MTATNGGGAGAPGPAPVATISLTFPADRPTDPAIRVEGVTRGQVYLAAYLIDLIAHEIRSGDLMAGALGGQAPGGPPADELARIATEILAGRH